MTYTKTFWRDVTKQLPPERDEEDGPKKYLVRIEKYGCQLALWYEGRFFENLAAPFENVTHWMEIPKIPLIPPTDGEND